MVNSKKIICFIFARGGSKAIPGKNILFLKSNHGYLLISNIRFLNGKPLIAYSIEIAKALPIIKEVILSTDSNEIAEVAKAYGANVPFMRPQELASDTAPELLAWKHAITYMLDNDLMTEEDVFLSLPPTAPLRNITDVNDVISKLASDEKLDLVVTGAKAHRHPAFNMLQKNDHGYLKCYDERGNFTRRQDTEPVFDMTTVAYAARAKYILKTDHLLDGNIGLVEVPKERALDIDDLSDLVLAEFYLQQCKVVVA